MKKAYFNEDLTKVAVVDEEGNFEIYKLRPTHETIFAEPKREVKFSIPEEPQKKKRGPKPGSKRGKRGPYKKTQKPINGMVVSNKGAFFNPHTDLNEDELSGLQKDDIKSWVRDENKELVQEYGKSAVNAMLECKKQGMSFEEVWGASVKELRFCSYGQLEKLYDSVTV